MANRIRKIALLGAVAACAAFASAPAYASLTVFQQYVGSVGLSTDGFGSTTQSGTISADVPAGATVVAAFLYTSMNGISGNINNPGGTLNGTAVSYTTALGINVGVLQAWRADVTSIVAPVINGGPGGVYNFSVTEIDGGQDGEALVVVYNDPTLPTQTVGILDGFSASAGDSSQITFASALHPGDPGFVADMRLGIGFSFDGAGCTTPIQVSTVAVNGTTITNNAGCNDDSADGFGNDANGNLITVGGSDDPFSSSLPSVTDDHERYDLTSLITDGDLVINVATNNPSNDDNIFLQTFLITGEGSITCPDCPPPGVPEPGTLALLGVGLAGVGAILRRRRQQKCSFAD